MVKRDKECLYRCILSCSWYEINFKWESCLEPFFSSTSTSFSNFPLEEVITVRSTRLLERRKKRGGPIPEVMVQETRNPPRSKSRRKSSKPYEPDNPVRNFLRRPEKKKLLTVQEETELFTQIHVHLVLYLLFYNKFRKIRDLLITVHILSGFAEIRRIEEQASV